MGLFGKKPSSSHDKDRTKSRRRISASRSEPSSGLAGDITDSDDLNRLDDTAIDSRASSKAKAKADRPVKQAANPASAAAAFYLKQAQDFERDRDADSDKRNGMLRNFAVGAFLVAIVSTIGCVSLVILKRPNPPAVLRVDSATGSVTVLPTSANGAVTWEEKTDRHNLEDYVVTREGYDWETINDMYAKVKLESDPREFDAYDAWIRAADGNLKRFSDRVRVYVKAGPTSYVGDTAQVFFCKRFVAPGGATSNPIPPEYWIATISRRYVNIPEKVEEQDVDPTGFRVSSYTRSKDWTRTNSGTGAAVGACQ